MTLTKYEGNCVQPDLVLTDGVAHEYVPSVGTIAKLDLNKNATAFKAKRGELRRCYILNPGPSVGVAFHFISGMIDVHYGFIKNSIALGILNPK
jgi:hypothetical protein